jgi:hypothetical protein
MRWESRVSKIAHSYRVHYSCDQMKNITLSADEEMIEQAREEAQLRKTTLNNLFREWLGELVSNRQRAKELDQLLKRLNYANAGRKISREELNER